MQCPSCSKTFAASLSVCPTCGEMPTQHYSAPPERIRTASYSGAAAGVAVAETVLDTGRLEPAVSVAEEIPQSEVKREFTSTLIEFPKRKNNEAEWRDVLRERVRASRERRENGAETEKPSRSRPEAARQKATAPVAAAPATVINLKPKVEKPRPASIVARALERVEQSRQVYHSAAGAVALAPVFEPQEAAAPAAKPQSALRLQPAPKPIVAPSPALTQPEPLYFEAPAIPVQETPKFDSVPQVELAASTVKIETTVSPLEESSAMIGAAAPAMSAATVSSAAAASKKEPRKLTMLSDADADKFIEAQTRVTAAVPQKKPSPRSGVAVEQEIAPRVRDFDSEQQPEIAEDYAPLYLRFIAAVLDIAICAGAAFGVVALFAPAKFFDADKFNLESALICAGVFAAVKFIYLTAAVVLAETTFAGRLFSLRTVHADDGSAATVLEAMLNSLGYLLTLALAGIGLIAILFSTERRAVHDWLSGTVVIRSK